MNTFKLRMQAKGKQAFTLIEIMVATVIMVVLVGLVVQITSEVLKVWTRSSGKLSANSEARIALDLLSQDLETAVFRNNGLQWLRVEGPIDPNGPVSSITNQTVSLKLFAPALDRQKEDTGGAVIQGDISAIGYRLAFKESYTGGDQVYALYRRIVDPKTTFDTYLGPSTTDTDQQVELTGVNWNDADIIQEENYLAGNIVEFKIFIYLEDPAVDPLTNDNLPVNVTASSSGVVFSGIPYAYGGATPGTTSPPRYAEVLLTVVTDEGLKLLENIDKVPETVEEVLLKHGQIFTRRVDFASRAL